MRERARLLQAELTIVRRPHGGTQVSVYLPIDDDKERRPWRLIRAIRSGS
jgi:nitrate/nitrite-specific signal transduction histidine kinase